MNEKEKKKEVFLRKLSYPITPILKFDKLRTPATFLPETDDKTFRAVLD